MTDNTANFSSGDSVLELVRNATDRIVVAAPYIKLAAMRRLLSDIPASVFDFTCITRWLPGDVAAGVCDLEIFEAIKEVRGGRLLLHPHLHAKYYSNGIRCLVGSANLTARGLGWHNPSNVELLVELPKDFLGLPEWESNLINTAMPATEAFRERLREKAKEVQEIQKSASPLHCPEVEDNNADETKRPWVPRCPAPDLLWSVYLGQIGRDNMVTSAYEAAEEDLLVLSPPTGLDDLAFEKYVAVTLKQMPIIEEIDRRTLSGLTDEEAIEHLTQRLDDSYPSDSYGQLWQVIKSWLIHFFPNSYRVETGQEVLVKGGTIIRR